MVSVEGLGIVLRPIGVVRHGFDNDFVRKSFDGVEGVVRFLKSLKRGLTASTAFLILFSSHFSTKLVKRLGVSSR